MNVSCWSLLEIEPTDDEALIRKAYARRLRQFRPDEDPAGFQALVEARTNAIAQAKWKLGRHEPNSEYVGGPGVSVVAKAIVQTEDAHTPDGQEPEERVLEFHPLTVTEMNARQSSGAEEKENFFRSLDVLLSEAPTRKTELPISSLWRAGPWAELFGRAANELDFNTYEAFLRAVARGIEGLFPPYQDHHLNSLNSFERGEGIAAVVEAIESECRFSERGDFLFQHCDYRSAYVYFEWCDVVREGSDIRRRRDLGKKAYFRGKVPIFPNGEEPDNFGGYDLTQYYRQARETGRLPWSFSFCNAFLPTYVILRYLNGPVGLLILSLVLLTLILAFKAVVSSILAAAIASFFVLLLARLWIGLNYKKLSLLYAVRRVISTDKKRIWDRKKRFVERDLNWSRYKDRFVKASFGLELFVYVLVVTLLAVPLVSIWQVRGLYSAPAEQIIADVVIPLLDNQEIGERLSYPDFFYLLSRIRSGKSDGFPLRSISSGMTAGDLPNKLWLPQFLNANGHDESYRVGSVEEEIRRRFVEYGPGPDQMRWSIERDKKLRVLAFLYRAAYPSLRMSIEERLLDFSALIDRPYNESSVLRQQTFWKIVPPRMSSDLSKSDEVLFHSAVLQQFMTAVGKRASKASEGDIFLQYKSLLEAKSESLVSLLSLKDFDPVPDIPLRNKRAYDPNLPADSLLRSLLLGLSVGRDAGDLVRPPSQRLVSSEIVHLPNIDVSMARRAYFEIASSVLSQASPELVVNALRVSVSKIPLVLHPSAADFWTTGAINLLVEVAGSVEFDPAKPLYFSNDSEEVEIWARQLVEGRF